MKFYMAIDPKTEEPLRPQTTRYGHTTNGTHRVYTTPARARAAAKASHGARTKVMVIEIDTEHCPDVGAIS